MKKAYMKPQMEVVKNQHTQMLCASNPYDYGDKTLGIPEGQVDDEEYVF